MRPQPVVFMPPALDQHLRLRQCLEDLPVQALIPQSAIERFHIAVFPRAARLDEQRLHVRLIEPLSYACSRKHRAVVAVDVIRNAVEEKALAQDLDHVLRLQLPFGPDRQALSRELVDHLEHPDGASVVRLIGHEIVRPDVVSMLRSQSDTRAISKPKPASLGSLSPHLQSLLTPDPRHRLRVPASARGQ